MLKFEKNSIYQTLDVENERLIKFCMRSKNSQYLDQDGNLRQGNEAANANSNAANGLGKLSQVNFGAANLSLKV